MAVKRVIGKCSSTGHDQPKSPDIIEASCRAYGRAEITTVALRHRVPSGSRWVDSLAQRALLVAISNGALGNADWSRFSNTLAVWLIVNGAQTEHTNRGVSVSPEPSTCLQNSLGSVVYSPPFCGAKLLTPFGSKTVWIAGRHAFAAVFCPVSLFEHVS